MQTTFVRVMSGTLIALSAWGVAASVAAPVQLFPLPTPQEAVAERMDDGSARDQALIPSIVYGDELLVQIAVSDLDKACEFYGQILGLPPISRTDSLKWAKFRLPAGAQLGVGEAERVSGSGTTSLNISVADIEAARALLEARGIVFDGPTQVIPGVVKLADFKDADGNRIRLAGAP